MDADGTRSKGIARALRKVGIKASHLGLIHFEHYSYLETFLNKLFIGCLYCDRDHTWCKVALDHGLRKVFV